jgi:hypothetical protein
VFEITVDRSREVAASRRRDLIRDAQEWRLVGAIQPKWAERLREQRRALFGWLGRRLVVLGQGLVDRHTGEQPLAHLQ